MVAGSADNIFLVGNYGDDDIWMRNVGDWEMELEMMQEIEERMFL